MASNLQPTAAHSTPAAAAPDVQQILRRLPREKAALFRLLNSLDNAIICRVVQRVREVLHKANKFMNDLDNLYEIFVECNGYNCHDIFNDEWLLTLSADYRAVISRANVFLDSYECNNLVSHISTSATVSVECMPVPNVSATLSCPSVDSDVCSQPPSESDRFSSFQQS